MRHADKTPTASDLGFDELVARVQIPIPLPAKEDILAVLRAQIPEVLKADVHAEITKLYTRGTFESIVEAAARDAFTKWLTEPDRSTGRSREDLIVDRFHHFMTEEVAGPRTRQDYLIKILLNAYPDLAKKLAETSPPALRVREVDIALMRQMVVEEVAYQLSPKEKD